MFSKLMVFGAMALALANAAPPSQNPLITASCNMNPNVAPISNQVQYSNANVAPVSNRVQSAGKIESGLYHIFSANLKYGGLQLYSALRSDGANKPIFVFRGEFSAPYTVWRVQVLDNYGHATIFDNDLDLPLALSNGWFAPVSGSFPQVFYLQPNSTSSENKCIIHTSDGNEWAASSQPPDYRRFHIAPYPHNQFPSANWIFKKYEQSN
ncbi:hypothetical protein DFH09DRAFT_1158544 [Mycena vulgaris]|nr:hypothetical protein DFH09DRAFT_1158544 [Mycena vulgaris]